MTHYRPLKNKPKKDPFDGCEGPVRNDVRDWNMLQGMTHQSDGSIQLRRDLDARLISVENALSPSAGGCCSDVECLAISISTIPCIFDGCRGTDIIPDLLPKPQFSLKAGETRAIGINPYESTPQYLYVYDSRDLSRPIIEPYRLSTNGQIFVIREGYRSGEFYIQSFKTAGFKG